MHGLGLPVKLGRWVDELSRFRGTSVERQLCLQVFKSLSLCYNILEMDLFASPDMAQLPLYLSYSQRMRAGGPDTFSEDWNRWRYMYLFSPLATPVLLRVMHVFRTFRG